MVKSIRIFGVILLILSGCLLGSAGLLAQEGGTIKGKVIDRNEKFPLPTVRVSVAGVKKYSQSAPDGSFTIKGVPPGVYKVVFEVAGYLTETVKDVTVAAGETAEVNASMSMGFAHGVTVTARREVESLQKVPQNVEILTETKLAETPQVNVVPDADPDPPRGEGLPGSAPAGRRVVRRPPAERGSRRNVHLPPAGTCRAGAEVHGGYGPAKHRVVRPMD